jgi:hypothetical protein
MIKNLGAMMLAVKLAVLPVNAQSFEQRVQVENPSVFSTTEISQIKLWIKDSLLTDKRFNDLAVGNILRGHSKASIGYDNPGIRSEIKNILYVEVTIYSASGISVQGSIPPELRKNGGYNAGKGLTGNEKMEVRVVTTDRKMTTFKFSY